MNGNLTATLKLILGCYIASDYWFVIFDKFFQELVGIPAQTICHYVLLWNSNEKNLLEVKTKCKSNIYSHRTFLGHICSIQELNQKHSCLCLSLLLGSTDCGYFGVKPHSQALMHYRIST